MKRKLTVLSLTLTLLFTAMFGGVASAANENDSKTQFTVARAVTMIVDQLDLAIDSEQAKPIPKASEIFENIADDDPYAEAFVIAHHNGLAIPEDVQPEKNISREWFAHLLFQAIQTKGDYAFISIYILINDEEQVTPEYMDSIQKILISKIATLDDEQNFRPQEPITWGRAMVWTLKAKQFIKKVPPIDPPAELPKPDGVEMSIAKINEDIQQVTLSWGEKPNPGYRITIDQIYFEEDKANIFYTLHEPDPEMMYPQVIVEPKAATYISSQYEPVITPLRSQQSGSIIPITGITIEPAVPVEKE